MYTKQMRLMEKADPKGRSIKQILVDALAEYGTFEAAANHLDLSRQTFSVWWYSLGCGTEPSEHQQCEDQHCEVLA